MEFDFREIEKKWRKEWEEKGTYKVTEDTTRPKYYVLDMFPYPSGAGLHVGHPLGYVASDIVARYKRLKGFNVLHPMGYDAFGLPAEQYAIETGTPPEVTTEKAIATYRSQLDKIGFSYDWSRQVKTSDPGFYKWTQWIFLKLFDSWYNREHNKAEDIFTLYSFFAENGCDASWPQYDKNDHEAFTDEEWNNFTPEEQQRILMHYRLAYQSYSEVNWCEALGTVLANDEVKDGKSERGGYPVERRKMRQWFLRITEYADRLLSGLDTLDWSEAMKDMQRNWIGRSEGALITFLTPGPSPKERGENTVITPALSEGEGANSQTASSETNDAAKFMTGAKEVAKTNLLHAKENRKQPTEAEDRLWQEIRNEKLGFKFRRQHLIDKYIVDFVCLLKGLVVEVDGSVHDFTKEEDEIRTNRLNEFGFTVIRFTNDEVFNGISSVLEKIKSKTTSLKERANIPVFQDENDEAVLPPLLRRGAGGEDNSDKAAVSPLPEGEGPDLPDGQAGVRIFTTRPDTIFGATFMVIAPEHELVESLTTPEQKQTVEEYITYVKSRTDVERQQEKKVTGVFTGSYAVNPFTEKEIPIYLAEYVLSGYGTGAIMAVPANDERDRKFAQKFGLPIIEVIDQSMHPSASIEDKVGKMKNSGMLNGLEVKDAIKEILDEIEDRGIGQRKVNYRQRDAGYSRQRYWGEPFPIVYKGDLPYPLPVSELPVTLPKVESYKPAGDGRSPIATATEWMNHPEGLRETDTMPGYAGSSWYFLRYMDPNNDTAFAAKDKLDYWQSVDLYLGGSEHAVGHLLYSRMWHKFLYDMGYVPTDEPFKKLVNQGMIQGVSAFTINVGVHPSLSQDNQNAYIAIHKLPMICISRNKYERMVAEEQMSSKQEQAMYLNFYDGIIKRYNETHGLIRGAHYDLEMGNFQTINIHVPISMVSASDQLDKEAFRKWRKSWAGTTDIEFYCEDDGSYLCPRAVEKMSKRYGNVVNPDDVIEKYGADCFRMFEMFLGPLDQSKPWDDKGISGVSSFLRRFWKLYVNEDGSLKVTDTMAPAPSPSEREGGEVKILHKTLKKISEDIERLQFNTCVSQFMICLNELNDLKCTKREILEPLLIALAPFAPFITEELWQRMGNSGSVHHAAFPKIEEKYLVESAFNYPISINGKVRANISYALDLNEADIRALVLADETVQKWLNGTEPKKFIFVKGRIINVVV